MSKHWSYFKYVMRHKRYVFQAGLKRGVPLWQLVIHDWSKFMPWEWQPYAEWFYGYLGGSWHVVLKEDPTNVPALVRKQAFERAFLYHLHMNPHHHQYWRLPSYGKTPEVAFKMPDNYMREMLADWDGAGLAISGKQDTLGWYTMNARSMIVHPETRTEIEHLL